MSAPAETSVNLPDAAALADLGRFVRRAIRLDPGGSIRLSGHGDVLAVYCSALSGGGGPTVLGLRTMVLATPGNLDVTLDLEALRDRLARLTGNNNQVGQGSHVGLDGQAGPAITLDLTPGSGAGAAWAGLLPPRSGWSLEGLLESAVLTTVAAGGIAEVAAGTPSGAGSAAVAQLRAKVWGRDLAENSQVPAGAAFAAEAFGFMGDEAVSVHRCGPWWRLSLLRGHILARRTSALS